MPIYAVIDKTRKRPQQQHLATTAAQTHQEASSAAVVQQQHDSSAAVAQQQLDSSAAVAQQHLDSSTAAANPQHQNSSASTVACPQEQDSPEAAASPQQRNSSVAVVSQQQQDLSAAGANPQQQQISPVAVAQKPISSKNTGFQHQEAANNDTTQFQEAVTPAAQPRGRTSPCSVPLTTSLVTTAEGRPEEAIENLELPAYPQPASFEPDSQTGLSADFPAPPPEGAASSDLHTESDLGYLETDFDLVETALSACDETRSKVSGAGVTGGVATAVVAGGNIARGDTLIATSGTSVAAGGAGVAVGGTNIASGSALVASGGASVAAGGASVTAGGATVAVGGANIARGDTLIATSGTSVAAGGAGVAVGGTNIASGSALVASGGASVAVDVATAVVGGANIARGDTLVASGGASVAAGGTSVAVGGANIACGITLVASGAASVEGSCENMPDCASSVPFDAVTATTKAATMRNYAAAHSGRSNASLAPFTAEKALLERRTEETETGLERGTEEGARNSVTFNSGFLYITQEQGKRGMDMK